MKRQINLRRLLAACAVLGTAALLAACGGSSSSKSSGSTASASDAAQSTSGNSSAVLTVESSQQNAITQNFNPFIQSSAASLLGATSLIYEPLLQANAIKPGQYYNLLATGYTWSNGGKSITFTIRPGVKWSDGTPMTAADVAFTYNLLKKYPDVNNTGLAVGSVSSCGNKVTLNFSSPQYANLQNIAGQTYIVPESIWSKVGDPGKYADPNPVGTGPYTVTQFSSQGLTLKANPNYWGGKPAVGTVQFPAYASANTALSALQTDQLHWAGNFIPGVQQAFEAGTPTTRRGSRRSRPTASSRT